MEKLDKPDVAFHIDWESEPPKYVAVVEVNGSEDDAMVLWRAKYGKEMPDRVYLDSYSESVTPAHPFLLEGYSLSNEEIEHINELRDRSDLTMDIMLLVLGDLDWRPLSKPSLSDEKWEIVLREDSKCMMTLEIILDLLGLDDSDFKANCDFYKKYKSGYYDWSPGSSMNAIKDILSEAMSD